MEIEASDCDDKKRAVPLQVEVVEAFKSVGAPTNDCDSSDAAMHFSQAKRPFTNGHLQNKSSESWQTLVTEFFTPVS